MYEFTLSSESNENLSLWIKTESFTYSFEIRNSPEVWRKFLKLSEIIRVGPHEDEEDPDAYLIVYRKDVPDVIRDNHNRRNFDEILMKFHSWMKD